MGTIAANIVKIHSIDKLHWLYLCLFVGQYQIEWFKFQIIDKQNHLFYYFLTTITYTYTKVILISRNSKPLQFVNTFQQ